ncbi:O-antigen ligase family protein [Acinetobacter indicus]|uniref:O-antigen ligase family protein n=1 Tax=Acinetobacter indicus TaxID=756892 RepID=UPI001444971D|nr:O-antigen ligase family protein [Acinetobacter indicus]
MNKELHLNVDNLILFIVSFFLYTGYYSGLGLIISLGFKDYSRFYSVPIRILISIAILSYLIKKMNKRYNYSLYVLLVMMSLFFIHYSMMIFLNIHDQLYMLDKIEYIFYLITWSILIFFYFLNFDLNKINLAIKYFIYAGLLMGLTSFILYRDFFLSGGGRISQMMYEDNNNFISPLALSYASVFNFIIFFSYIKDYKVKNKKLTILAWLMLLFSIPMFILGASRGAFIACILCFIYVWFFSSIKNKITSIIIAPIFTYLVYWVTISTGNNAFERFFNIKSDIDSNSSSTSRLDLWNQAWIYFKESPLFGGYLEVGGVYPHNILFELLMNTGLIGLVLFGIPFLFLSLYSLIISNIKNGYLIPLILILGLCMHLFSGAIYFAPILFTALGLIGCQLNLREGKINIHEKKNEIK